jgi:N-glycosylase/DNA lyase
MLCILISLFLNKAWRNMLYDVEFKTNSVVISGLNCFDLEKSCTCAQAFRWEKMPDGFRGIVGDKSILAVQKDGRFIITPCAPEDLKSWAYYFDLDRDYTLIERAIVQDARLVCCMPDSAGIHVFNQDPFETLITFIISANNNAGRIKGIVSRLCCRAGTKMRDCYGEYDAFPLPDQLAALSEAEIEGCGAGYRAQSIKEAARKVAEGYDLEALRGLPLDDARSRLKQFRGVGPKVADCVLLFSLGYADAFPIDVWINRAVVELFFNGIRPTKKQIDALVNRLGGEAGIAQQYLFHYARISKLGKVKKEKTN